MERSRPASPEEAKKVEPKVKPRITTIKKVIVDGKSDDNKGGN
jgi:hypothetical protein